MIPAADVRTLLNYDPETGVFTWRVKPSCRVSAGSVAGFRGGEYMKIKYRGSAQLAHRLAVAWMTGAYPSSSIDHADLNKCNNAWSNLRCATDSQNQANSRARSHNGLGVKGVSLVGARYVARITVKGKTIFLGSYKTSREASESYAAASKEYYSEFARGY